MLFVGGCKVFLCDFPESFPILLEEFLFVLVFDSFESEVLLFKMAFVFFLEIFSELLDLLIIFEELLKLIFNLLLGFTLLLVELLAFELLFVLDIDFTLLGELLTGEVVLLAVVEFVLFIILLSVLF